MFQDGTRPPGIVTHNFTINQPGKSSAKAPNIRQNTLFKTSLNLFACSVIRGSRKQLQFKATTTFVLNTDVFCA